MLEAVNETGIHASTAEKPFPDRQAAGIALDEVQLLLSEKRTSLSTLRTGIAIFAFPLSVLSVLIATSRSYEIKTVWPLLAPLLALNLALTALAVYLIVHAMRRIRHYNRQIDEIKRGNIRLAELLD